MLSRCLFRQAADFDELQAKRLGLGQHPIERGLVGKHAGQHGVAAFRPGCAFLLMARTLASGRVSECHLIGAIALRHGLPSESRHGSFGKSKSYPERTRSAHTRGRSGVAR